MNALAILHLEDNAFDAHRIQSVLDKDGWKVAAQVVKTRCEYIAAMERGGFDLILCENGVEGFSGRSAFEIAHQKYPKLPFIFVSGNVNEEEAAAYLRIGAVDYIYKEQLWRLPLVARYALERSSCQQLERYNHSMELLVTVVQKLSLARSLDQITAIVRHAARELTGADGATFVLREGNMCYYAEENAIQPLWKGRRFPIDICMGGWCMLNRQQAIIEDVYGDERIPIEAYEPTFIKSLVMVPIRKEAPIGAIGNYWAEKHTSTPEEVHLIQALADSTSVAMENVQVYSELEQRVRERTSQLEFANQELEAFSYTISHDLRSPLRSIIGFSELLQMKYNNQLDEQGKQYLNRVSTSAKGLNTQIDAMLSLHKLTQVELKRETVDLSNMVQEILSNIKAVEANRQVETHVAQGLTVNGDPVLLRVMLENLLSNAWKYSAKVEQPRIEFAVKKETNNSSVFYVRDNGAGFDMKRANKLFRPFQRLHSDNEFPGTGVGLASVQRIIHKHGGRIWVEAAVGRGATFYFTIE
ncbi:multi-sensor signal transduction histidine kinase [Scytonema sp. HK-05]|uniref:ATP-binding protein n=1 Tax=Scytonema sp. HK-05 TaxID=1137095 RepID=UPI0009362639|nr:ATP-binding protein [Scytonema sp. HK-05]OKH60645.1 histidine kinase [Scytonema sp. HK-05]BAY46050.1 multi-sensor signal transduction histidine kinase [Scytonema sp. HK-05]